MNRRAIAFGALARTGDHRNILEKEELRFLLGEACPGLAFESDGSGLPVESCVCRGSWRSISREVMVDSSLVMETSAMPVKFGCLVRCVVYSPGDCASVRNVSMEFVPNARIHRMIDPQSGQACHRLE